MKTLSFHNYLFRDNDSNTQSSTLTAIIDSVRFDTNNYLAVFTLIIPTTNEMKALKIPVNKFWSQIILRLINTHSRTPTTMETDLATNKVYVYQDGAPVQPAPLNTTNQHAFMLNALQYLLDTWKIQ